MSDDIAQAPREDTSLSNANTTANAIQNPQHSQSANSAASHGMSSRRWSLDLRSFEQSSMLTEKSDNPASKAHPIITGPSTAASGLSAADASADRDSTTLIGSVSNQDTASEGRLGPSVPIRSSSNSKLNSSVGTPMNSQTTDDLAQNPRSGSTGSVKAKNRSGSIASSKRSRKEKAVGPAVGSEEKPGLENPRNVAVAPKQKKRGVSKFLTFLNCCSAPDNANPVELDDQAVPAKKTRVLQTNRNRQETPGTKANASAAESSAGESKEGVPDNIGGPPYSELTAAAMPTMSSQKAGDSLLAEKPALPTETEPTVSETTKSLGQDETRNQPLPPLPPTANPEVEMDNPKADLSTTSGIIAPVEPLASSKPEENMLTAIPAIDDRTPQQKKRDSDVQMMDAPPIMPEEQASSTQSRETGQTQLNLPPPPPRSSQERPVASETRTASNGVAPNENQKWLLPPLQPRFMGKKCLVLDLDETLVHSSFKVRVSKLGCFAIG